MKDNRVMVINRWLAKKNTILWICVIQDTCLFFLYTYILNLFLNIPKWIQDLEHPLKYFLFLNFVPTSLFKVPVLYLVWIILAALLNMRMIFGIRSAYGEEHFNVSQKGDSRWTTDEEIREQYAEVPEKEIPFAGTGGMIVSRMDDKLYIDQSNTNNLIIGMTRSGKGEMFVIPSIDIYSRAEKQASMIITDPKIELYKSSKKTLEERGYKVYLLNLDNQLKSMGFNPLEQVKQAYLSGNEDDAELLAQSFSYSVFNNDKDTNADPFWKDTAAALLTALILAHIEDCMREDQTTGSHKNEKKINMFSIINTFQELARQTDENNPDKSALDYYFAERPMMNRAKMKYSSIEIAGDRTKSSIYSSMMSKLTIFTFEKNAKMTAESTLELEKIGFGDQPIAVFLGIPDYDKSMDFLASVFIRQLTFILEKKASRSPSGKCGRQVKFICDEFGNLPAIEGMGSIVTVCLGRNISFDLYLQSYSQLSIYGDDAPVIEENCGNQIYIMNNSSETAEKFSKLLGNETIVDVQRSGEKLSLHKNYSENLIEKPLLSANQLMELQVGECVVKRVMKRTDLKGNKIRPTPIFNSIKSGKQFLYRYQYLKDTFPDPNSINLDLINQEDRTGIVLNEIVWDYRLSFLQIQEQKKYDVMVKDMEAVFTVKKALSKYLSDEEMKKISSHSTVRELYEMVNQMEASKDEKQMILKHIDHKAYEVLRKNEEK